MGLPLVNGRGSRLKQACFLDFAQGEAPPRNGISLLLGLVTWFAIVCQISFELLSILEDIDPACYAKDCRRGHLI
jgi:hypothetical protein